MILDVLNPNLYMYFHQGILTLKNNLITAFRIVVLEFHIVFNRTLLLYLQRCEPKSRGIVTNP